MVTRDLVEETRQEVSAAFGTFDQSQGCGAIFDMS
jgi:hypothetical protein